VLDAHAEAERADRAGLGDALAEGAEDQQRARVVAGVEVVEVARSVAALARPEAVQVDAVADAEVLKGAEETAADRVPEADLRGDVPVEVVENAEVIGALGGRGEAEQLARAQAP
jgi:hypothetical protein